MERYVRNFVKRDKFLDLYIKIPWWKKPYDMTKYFKEKYFDGYMSYIGCAYDKTQKYIIVTFVLRDKSDIQPYIKSYNELKEMINK